MDADELLEKMVQSTGRDNEVMFFNRDLTEDALSRSSTAIASLLDKNIAAIPSKDYDEILGILYKPTGRIKALLAHKTMKEIGIKKSEKLIDIILKLNIDTPTNIQDLKDYPNELKWIMDNIKSIDRYSTTIDFDYSLGMTSVNNVKSFPCVYNILGFDVKNDNIDIVNSAEFKRIGTEPDGSCFVHSIFRSILRDYPEIKDKTEFAINVRKVLSDQYTKDVWYTYNNNDHEEIDGKIRDVLLEMGYPEKDEKKSIASLLGDKTLTLKNYKEKISSNLLEKDVETFKNKYDEIENEVYDEYKQYILDYEKYIRDVEIPFLSDIFNLDIYVIRDKTRQPYVVGDCKKLYKGRKSIIVVWVGELHYEVVAFQEKEIKASGRDKLVTIFQPDHPVIKRLKTFLCCSNPISRASLNTTDPPLITRPFGEWIVKSSKGTGIDYGRFDTIDNFSSLMPYQIKSVSDFFKKEMPSASYIVDANGHIGCDSVNFSRLYPEAKIDSCEIDKKTFDVLKENIRRMYQRGAPLNRENIQLLSAINIYPVNKDSIKYINELEKADMIYFDPPWDGKDYKLKERMDLFMTTDGKQKSIGEIVKDVFEKEKTKDIFLKLPFNFDMESFKKTVDSEKITRKLVYTSAKIPNFKKTGIAFILLHIKMI